MTTRTETKRHRGRARRPRAIPCSEQIRNVVLAETQRLARAITGDELRGAYVNCFGSRPDNLVQLAMRLVARGELWGREVRSRLYCFAHSDAPYPLTVPHDDWAAAAAVVNAHWSKYGQPMSTSAVRKAMIAAGIPVPRSGYIFGLLARLAKPTQIAGAVPPVQQVPSTTGLGAIRWLWAPGGVVLSPTQPTMRNVGVTSSDLLRNAIRIAEPALTRPISMLELGLWRDAHPTHVAAAAMATISFKTYAPVLKSDAKHVGDPSRIHSIRPPITAQGGAPPRMVLGPPTAMQRLVCALEDCCYIARPDEELTGIAAQQVRADEFDLPELRPIAKARERALAAMVRDLCAPLCPLDFDDAHAMLRDAVDVLECSWRTFAEWTGAMAAHQGPAQSQRFKAHRSRYHQRIRQYNQRLRQIEALRVLIARPAFREVFVNGTCAASNGTAVVQLLGPNSSVTMDALLPMLQACDRLVGRRLEIAPETARQFGGLTFLRRARRTPLACGAHTTSTSSPRIRREASIDRIDAIAAIVGNTPLAKLQGYFAVGLAVIGYVVRDAAWFQHQLGLLPPGQDAIRRALVIALGLLGQLVPRHVALPLGEALFDVEAYIAHMRFAELDDARFTQQLEALMDELTADAATSAVDHALMRLELGRPFSILE